MKLRELLKQPGSEGERQATRAALERMLGPPGSRKRARFVTLLPLGEKLFPDAKPTCDD
jgi:hypothetical protein